MSYEKVIEFCKEKGLDFWFQPVPYKQYFFSVIESYSNKHKYIFGMQNASMELFYIELVNDYAGWFDSQQQKDNK